MTVLAALLDPISPERFCREHWDRAPLHVPGPPHRFAEIYDAATWQTFDGVDDLKAATTGPNGYQVETPILSDQAGLLFMNGFTICADVSKTPRVAPFLDAFRNALDLPGVGGAFAKLYASGDGKGFAVHADRFHVFVLQISGKKRWRFSRAPVVAAPMDGLFVGPDGQPYWTSRPGHEPALHDDGAPVPPPDEAAFAEALLEPGHLLYLPPGTWHVARAVGHSIAVSVSPARTTVLDLATRLLHELFTGRAEWRRDALAPPGDAHPPGQVPASVSSQLDARLGELRDAVARLDARRLHRLWRLDVAQGQASPGAAPAALDPDAIHRSDGFEPVGELPFDFVVAPAPGGDDERCFFYRGGEWSLPGAARRFLAELARHVAAGGPVRAEEALAWDRALKFQQVREILATLVTAGVLRLRPRAR